MMTQAVRAALIGYALEHGYSRDFAEAQVARIDGALQRPLTDNPEVVSIDRERLASIGILDDVTRARVSVELNAILAEAMQRQLDALAGQLVPELIGNLLPVIFPDR